MNISSIQPQFSAEHYARCEWLIRAGNEAVQEALEENRRLGIPNAFRINGKLCFEMPNGELTTTNPFSETLNGASSPHSAAPPAETPQDS